MKTAIDKAGRVVIPKSIREQARLRPGTELEITLEYGQVRLARKVPRPKLVKKGLLLVAVPTAPRSSLPQIDLSALIEDERNRGPE